MTLPVAVALAAALVAGFAFARWFQQQQRRDPPRGVPIERTLECGKSEEFGPFEPPQGTTKCKVLVILRDSCSGRMEIELEDAPGTWKSVQITVPGLAAGSWREPVDPMVPSSIVLTLARGRKLRVRCPEAEQPVEGRKCKITIIDISTRPLETIPLREDTTDHPRCGSFYDTGIINRSDFPVVLQLVFTKVCTSYPGGRQPIEMKLVATHRAAPMREQALTTITPVASGDPMARATVTVMPGYALHVKCTGADGGCEFTIRLKS